MEAPQTASDSQPEASTTPLTTIHDCKEYLQALPQGRQAMKYAVNQIQQSVRLQAAKAADHVEICVQRNLRILDGSHSSTSERSKAAIALENCVMAAIHNQVFDTIAQIHKAEDTALHAFLEQLMAGQYDLYGTSPDLHVQDSGSNGLSEASRHQQAEGSQAEGSVPDQVWNLCGVPVGLQAADLRLASHRLQQLDSVQCPLEVVSCLHQTDEAITEAVGKVRRSDKSVGPLSSDSLLPLFIVAIIVAQPLHLHACLAYVRTFHKHADWAGQTGFQVATLEAAITFLQQLLPGRSMTTGTACNPPDLLRALSMERSRSGKLLMDQESLVRSACDVCIGHPDAAFASSVEATPDRGDAANRREAAFGGLSLVLSAWSLAWPQTAASFSLPQSFDFSHLLPPEPVAFPRKVLDQRFAVLLLRSTYDAVDALDFIAMDQFQIQFWKTRQAEYEPYLLQYSPIRVRQGDLTDPLYFDFISFAQYSTVGTIIPKGLQVFKEFCEDCPDQSKTVRRDATFKDNSALPAQVALRTGDFIYDGLRNGFREEIFPGTPEPLTASQSALVPERVQKLLSVFVDRGFAIKAQVTAENTAANKLNGGGAFTVRMEAPANLWGVGALQSRQALMVDAVDAMTVQAYLRASGFASDYTLQRSSTAIEQRWSFQPMAGQA
ncbi:hypothetical protein WJX79_006735 [Trebouxia sp. C0005]